MASHPSKFDNGAKYPPLGLNDTIKFGKHKNKTVLELIGTDPGYLLWYRDQRLLTQKDGGFHPDAHLALDMLLIEMPSLARKHRSHLSENERRNAIRQAEEVERLKQGLDPLPEEQPASARADADTIVPWGLFS